MRSVGRALRNWDDAIDGFAGQLKSALTTESPSILTLRLTLLLVVLHGATSPFAAVIARVLGILMLVLPALVTRASLWWLLALTLVASTVDQWELVDNHQYLMTYWVLACATTLARPADLSTVARLLLGVAFTFAAAWKIVAGEYLDGSFFYLAFLTDGRLQSVATFIAGDDAGAVRHTIDAIGQLAARGMAGSQIAIENHGRIVMAALVLSWIGLALEAAIGVLHIVPGRRLYPVRHAALMMFVAGTYILLPVTGFGFLLGVMGFSQTRDDDRRLKIWYVALLCFLQLTLVPWRDLLPVPA